MQTLKKALINVSLVTMITLPAWAMQSWDIKLRAPYLDVYKNNANADNLRYSLTTFLLTQQKSNKNSKFFLEEINKESFNLFESLGFNKDSINSGSNFANDFFENLGFNKDITSSQTNFAKRMRDADFHSLYYKIHQQKP